MANGIYAAAAGMAAQETNLNAIANDLANVSTTGFKSERVGFENLLASSQGGIGVGGGAAALDAGPSDAQGQLAPSSNPLALAISGPGYFQVRQADGSIGLTRDGNFQVDASGALVTDSGDRLVPPIKLPAGVQPSQVSISSAGTVSAQGKTLGTIQLVDVPATSGLLNVGANVYATTAASGAATPVTGSTLSQGELEGSDVNVSQEMTDMLNAQQNYSMLSQVLSTQDQMLQIANELPQK
jgi:flagellar basal-body rod protein FlgG